MDRFCLRRVTIASRTRSWVAVGRGPLRDGAKKVRLGSCRNWWQRMRKLPGVYPNRAAASWDGSLSTKYARRASYWRWVEVVGSRNRLARAVSGSLELVNTRPLYHVSPSSPSTIFGCSASKATTATNLSISARQDANL